MYNRIVICGARSGSQRVKNKNIKNLGKHKLIEYTLRVARMLSLPVYVSSDSDEILKAVSDFSDSLVRSTFINIKRPIELASNISTDLDWIKHLLDEYYITKREYPDQLIFLRPTTPFRDANIVRKAMKKFDSTKYSSLRSVEEMKESIYKTYSIKNCYLEPFNKELSNLPNQQVPTSYSANGYVDILVTKQILENNELYGNSIMPFVTERTMEIDDEFDFKLAKGLMK